MNAPPSTPAVRVQMRRLGIVVAAAWLERHGWMREGVSGSWWHPLLADEDLVDRTEAFRRQNAALRAVAP